VVTVNGALKYNGTTDVLDLFGHNLILNGTIGGTNASGAIRTAGPTETFPATASGWRS
jgi:hypothetical protein